MVGLTVDQVADAIFLGGNYGGVSAYSIAVKVAQKTIAAMAKLAGDAITAAGSVTAASAQLTVLNVVPALK
jgi:hypothetical protein